MGSSDNEVYQAVTEAYQRLMSYQITQGSNKGAFTYSINGGNEAVPSTFLTALASSTLYKLRIQYKHPVVDGVVLQRALNWLFRSQDPVEGNFRETNVYHGNYQVWSLSQFYTRLFIF